MEIERNPLRARIYGGENYYPPPYINNKQNAVQNLLGNFYSRNAAYYQPTPQVNNNPNAARDLWNGAATVVNDYVAPQAIQTALMASAGGLGALGLGLRTAAPYALTALGARSLTAPIANGLIKFANTPAGKTLGNYAGNVIDWLW